MSHSNHDGQLPAESGEGRLLIKENVRQPNTLSTYGAQSACHTGLVDVPKAAQEIIPRIPLAAIIRDKSRMR
jgi:hypothetical protein